MPKIRLQGYKLQGYIEDKYQTPNTEYRMPNAEPYGDLIKFERYTIFYIDLKSRWWKLVENSRW